VLAFGQRSMFLTEDNSIYVSGIDFGMMPIEKYKLVDKIPHRPKYISLGLEHCLILDGKI
jgi:hypothetical protein